MTALAEAAPHARIAVAEVPCFAERDLALGGPTSARNDPARVAAVNEVLAGVVAAPPGAARVAAVVAVALRQRRRTTAPTASTSTPESARALWAGPLGEWVASSRPLQPGFGPGVVIAGVGAGHAVAPTDPFEVGGVGGPGGVEQARLGPEVDDRHRQRLGAVDDGAVAGLAPGVGGELRRVDRDVLAAPPRSSGGSTARRS